MDFISGNVPGFVALNYGNLYETIFDEANFKNNPTAKQEANAIETSAIKHDHINSE